MPKVNTKRREFLELEPRWALLRDCISGEDAVKKQTTKYLPAPNSADTSEENKKRYEEYKTRAVFYGVTGRTQRGLVGEVFGQAPVAKMPDAMKVLQVDADGAGVSLDQQSRKALGRVLAFGRAGLLIDYPQIQTVATKADLMAGNIRPTVTLFDPWDIINWRVVTKGAKKFLTLVVLAESEVIDDDGFAQEQDDFYRVLRLNAAGIYIQEIWYFDKTKNDYVIEETITPLKGDGQPWNEIPFTFIGSENNDSEPDLPPMYDLACLNIAHYRNSADYEETAFVTGQPTPYVTEMTESWANNVLKGKLTLGSRAVIPLPKGSTAGLLQPEPNSIPFEAMQHKERQMVALGAKLVEQAKVQRTATEAGMEEAATSSVLAIVANNVSAAYTQALKWAANFLNIEFAEDDISYDLNTEFAISKLTADERARIVADWQAGAITFGEMRQQFRAGGAAYLSDEDALEKLDEAPLDLSEPAEKPTSNQE